MKHWMVLGGLCVILGGWPGASQADTGSAALRATDPASSLAGEVTFEDTDDGLHILATVTGAPPGLHGFHIHEFGSCENGGKAAGGHYNPDGVAHGNVLLEDSDDAHAGDLGNLEVGANGSGQLDVVAEDLVLTDDEYAVAGRAVILHELADDFGQPTGNAGGRIGCGPIVLRGP